MRHLPGGEAQVAEDDVLDARLEEVPPERDRKITVYDNWRTRTGDIYSPKVDATEPLRLECQHFLDLVAGEDDPHKAARDAVPVVRALEQLQASLETVVA